MAGRSRGLAAPFPRERSPEIGREMSRLYPGTGEGLGAGGFHERVPTPGYKIPPKEVHDYGQAVPSEDVRNELLNLTARISDLVEFYSEQTRRVDEYNVGTPGAPISTTTVSLFPEYDLLPEIIGSILVIGPAATTFTLQLGKRVWTTLVTDARGVWQLTSLQMELQRSDARVLTSATAGNWSLELMGTADTGTSYRYK